MLLFQPSLVETFFHVSQAYQPTPPPRMALPFTSKINWRQNPKWPTKANNSRRIQIGAENFKSRITTNAPLADYLPRDGGHVWLKGIYGSSCVEH